MKTTTVMARDVRPGDQIFNSSANVPEFRWAKVIAVVLKKDSVEIVTDCFNKPLMHPMVGISVVRANNKIWSA